MSMISRLFESSDSYKENSFEKTCVYQEAANPRCLSKELF